MSATTADRGTADGRPTDDDTRGGRTDDRRTGRGGRVVLWVVIVLVGLLLAALTAVVQSSTGPSRDPLDPRSASASGAKALVRVLEQQGTAVDVVDRVDRLDTDDLRDATVLVDDSASALDATVAARLGREARHVVLLSTDRSALDALGLGVEPAGRVTGDAVVSTTGCAIPAAEAAGRITSTGDGYRPPDTARAPAATDFCVPTGDGDDRLAGLVRTSTPGGDVTLVGTSAALRNDTITTAGNAAFALGLLGSEDRLVWYTPTSTSADAAPTLGSLAPPWVPGAILLLALVAVAAGVWRGRRLGPLVVERMPVVVRAAETTEGRARLYARARDRTHSLDTLRIAAIRRTARRLGLPPGVHVDEVVRAAARATGRADAAVGAVLVGGPTRDDRALVDGAAALDELERAVQTATGAPVGRRSGTGTGTGTTTNHRNRRGARS
ncbi:DUF4350 domain-containing protein [Curtobacterium caseinilyticum]|uniref:DUF4350 domain-containing protein n=1 Tax=Curtobacterium caseinilyticum TaxID=3055137 RepID=A0ABT7TT27_9MICO|nr:DUF4350 domain-containing protein [Curtobacterium caseinilyticum]MDM7892763.1 DUF4350 domain-containing protein [Curtobacterium caseinilyticum]